MGKISNYTRALVAKLQDVFVVDQTDNNVTTTKSVTVEQIGDAICGEQVHADLETDDQTIIGGINENKDKVGDLSQLTTTDKSSLVGAVNEISTYTTSETVVGKWTDGRAVYQRVFDGLNITTTVDTWVDTGVARGEVKKIIGGFALDAEQSFVCAFGFSAGNILINMPIARSALNSIVIRYVKNT